MAPIEPADPRLLPYRRLRDLDLGREDGLVALEGELVLRRAVACGASVRSVLATAGWVDRLADLDLPVLVVDQALMDGIVGYPIHRGLVAMAERPDARSVAEVAAGARTVAALEAVNDHENLGALFRNAAAFGVDAVVLDDRCAEPLYRRSIRVSLGHVLAVPHARSGRWIDELEEAGLDLVALTPDPAAAPVELLADLGRVALLLGAEGPGLSPATLSRARHRVRIPMAPGVDSLNVATAAAIAFHHRFETGARRAGGEV
ncbi:MAG: TrmH family RNA methyltransferase [Acidimicrobiia bacterium]